MNKITCVTSMTQKMHDYIGSVMIESWSKYFPEPHKLTVYAEDCITQPNKRVIVKNWHDECYRDWEKFSLKTDSHGSKRFAKKGFSFLHAMENATSRFIIWIDADVLFHKPLPQEKLDSILPEGKLVALFDCFYQEVANHTREQYLNIKDRPQMGAESGFVIIDTAHKNFNEYKKRYRELYEAPEKPEVCRSWYDGEVVIESARFFLDQVFDLSDLKTSRKTQTPLNRTWMGEYFTHQKGRSKASYTTEQLREFTK